MIKVLHMVPFGGGIQGGIENLLINIYKNIDKNKVQFDFITYGNGEKFMPLIENMGGKIFHLTSRKVNPIKAYIETKQFFEKYGHEYKFFHFHLCTASNILPLRVLKNIERVIVHSHSSTCPNNKIIKFLHMHNKTKMLKVATDLFACSDLAANHMFGENYILDSRYKFFPNAIDTGKFKFDPSIRTIVRKELECSNNFTLGYVGRLSKDKRVDYVLDVFYEMIKMQKKCRLVIIGDGGIKESLEQKVVNMGLKNNVIFLGARNDVNRLLQGIDIFISASNIEGLPVSVIEAEAAGIKCVLPATITKQANINNMITYLDNDSNETIWAKKILDLINYKREDMSIFLEEAGFDIIKLSENLQKFYLEGFIYKF